MISKIKKRDGRIVTFEREKIEQAILKAAHASNQNVEYSLITAVTDSVIATLETSYTESIPAVEQIQDIVERQISDHGLFEVAKAYILYRYERQKKREDEQLTKIEEQKLHIIKRNKKVVPFMKEEVASYLRQISEKKITSDDQEGILAEVEAGIFDNITSREITKVLIMACNARIEKDPVFSYYSARILLNELYKDIIKIDEFDKDFAKIYRFSFRAQIQKGIDAERLSPDLLGFDIAQISEAIEPKRDLKFNYMGIETLYERYFARDYEQHVLELPQHFFMRVAMGLAMSEKKKDRSASAIKFYQKISKHEYMPSTPTLFHAGTMHPQMSSCYINTVEDDLANIFKCIGDNAQLSKWSGGIGTDWSNIRGTGALVKSANINSQGVIPFLKIADATTASINRSGKRRGAACVYLEAWHYDFEDFIELRKNTGDERRRTHDTDIAAWIPDLFIKRVMANQTWTLFSPDETPDLHHMYGKDFEKAYKAYEQKAEKGEITLFKHVSASVLWRKMLTLLFESGHPWITFKDPCNIRSPQDHVGVVHSSNLCTEITLNTSNKETAVCNLGSINIPEHIKSDGTLNKTLLKESVQIAIRMLDNVIDKNFYPTKEAEYANKRNRPVGLGVMGLQDALFKMGLNFDSDEAVIFSDELMEFVSYYAILTSSELAKEKGRYTTFSGSKWDRGIFPLDSLSLLEKERGEKIPVDRKKRLDWAKVKAHVKKYGMRNSNCMAIAPTATISTIVGSYPTCEPIYENLYVKSNQTGEFTVINEYLVKDLKKIGLWSDEIVRKIKYFDGSIQRIEEIPASLREKYKETFEIDPLWTIKHAAYRGKWIDQSQSTNIFTASQSGKAVSEVYIYAWKMGLKTTYYLRTLGASHIEKSTLDINVKYDKPSEDEVINTPEETDIPQCKIDDPTCESCQ